MQKFPVGYFVGVVCSGVHGQRSRGGRASWVGGSPGCFKWGGRERASHPWHVWWEGRLCPGENTFGVLTTLS